MKPGFQVPPFLFLAIVTLTLTWLTPKSIPTCVLISIFNLSKLELIVWISSKTGDSTWLLSTANLSLLMGIGCWLHYVLIMACSSKYRIYSHISQPLILLFESRCLSISQIISVYLSISQPPNLTNVLYDTKSGFLTYTVCEEVMHIVLCKMFSRWFFANKN